MAKGRELKGRIKSVENTRKITRTMEMVATSKMKRAQDRVVAARPFANSLTEVIANLYTPELAESFPLMRQPVGARGLEEGVLHRPFAREALEDLREGARVGRGGGDAALGPLGLGGRHELHRPRDLLRVGDGADLLLEVLGAGHGSLAAQ